MKDISLDTYQDITYECLLMGAFSNKHVWCPQYVKTCSRAESKCLRAGHQTDEWSWVFFFCFVMEDCSEISKLLNKMLKYLSSPPVIPHQMTACLSETLMSLDRLDTVRGIIKTWSHVRASATQITTRCTSISKAYQTCQIHSNDDSSKYLLKSIQSSNWVYNNSFVY